MHFLGFGQYMNASRIFIGMFEIDIPGYEAVLHHQNGIEAVLNFSKKFFLA